MALLIQHIIVGVVVIAAVAWLVRYLWSMLHPSNGCGGCAGCAVQRMADAR